MSHYKYEGLTHKFILILKFYVIHEFPDLKNFKCTHLLLPYIVFVLQVMSQLLKERGRKKRDGDRALIQQRKMTIK